MRRRNTKPPKREELMRWGAKNTKPWAAHHHKPAGHKLERRLRRGGNVL